MSASILSLRSILRVFAGLALIAGVLLFAGADDTGEWFSWTIQPPLSAAALGAYYWGACALLVAASRSPSWAGARPVVLPVLVIATVLLVITLVHLDKFDLGSLFGAFWLCAYIVAPPLLAAGIARERAASGPGAAAAGRRLPGALRVALIAEAALLLVASALMLLAPETAAELWPWALTPLTSRALGAFTLGVSLVALMVVRDDTIVLFRGTAAAYAALGMLQLLAVALHSGDLGGDGLATGAYLGFWAAVALTGAYGLIAASASSRS
ncbi:MAG: hypothetical protein ACXWZ3_10085 [Solirubrobacterales bacterium]